MDEDLLSALDRAALEVRMARDRRARIFPEGARCSVCGVDETWLLVKGRQPPLCYQCDCKRRGLSGRERHHICGEGSPIQVLLPANRHRFHELYQDAVEKLALEPEVRCVLELALFVAFEVGLDHGPEAGAVAFALVILGLAVALSAEQKDQR